MRVDDCSNMEKPPRPVTESGNSGSGRSRRSSLLITHEDGTVEENSCLVTSLGFSNMDTESLSIEEIGQTKHTTRNMHEDNNKLNSPEDVGSRIVY